MKDAMLAFLCHRERSRGISDLSKRRGTPTSLGRSIRHSAALALVGWYLMVPPTIPGTGMVNRGVPLSQWNVRGEFPRNPGCENAKARLHVLALASETQSDAAYPHRGLRNPELHCILCNVHCVAEDDPRLKPN